MDYCRVPHHISYRYKESLLKYGDKYILRPKTIPPKIQNPILGHYHVMIFHSGNTQQ
jgi:hypothetical protein